MMAGPAAIFESAAITDTGRTRDTNEDCLAAIPEWGVFVVADGVGGLSAGDVASSQVCDTIRSQVGGFDGFNGQISDTFINTTVRSAIADANTWIRNEAESREVRGMGTTVVLLALSAENPGQAVALHAGDSRLYRLRDSTLEQLTEDHSIAGQLGVHESTLHPFMQGVITRAVGIQPDVELDETPVDVRVGDVFMVCSDGLTRMVDDATLQEMLLVDRSLDDCARSMVAKANEAGGYDNITVILVRVRG